MSKLQLSGKTRKTVWLFAKYLFYRVQDAMILRSAAALSYTTLLAVVPFMAVVLAVFAFFPMFADMRAQVQEMLIRYVMPDMIQNVQHYINVFIGAAGKLTTIGLAGIALTAVFAVLSVLLIAWYTGVRNRQEIEDALKTYNRESLLVDNT